MMTTNNLNFTVQNLSSSLKAKNIAKGTCKNLNNYTSSFRSPLARKNTQIFNLSSNLCKKKSG